jgi:hypothetical protein
VAILALEQNAGLGRSVEGRQNHDGPSVTDDLAKHAYAGGFYDALRGHPEYRALVNQTAGEDPSFVF